MKISVLHYFWSPGDENNPAASSDDRKAATILAACNELPVVVACPTQTLSELIAGLSVCKRILCSDGGHMHLAAATGKPIVCLFGKSEAARWHPWGVPYTLLQAPSQDVNDVTVDEVLASLQ